MMPEMDGVQVCRNVRKEKKEPYIYVLLLTAKDEKEDLATALNSGADDYIAKPFDQLELQARLRAGRRMIELHTELISMREALRIQALRDGLTELWNRSAIFDILQRELARATRQFSPVGVLMADLDFFKKVNDTYGHLAGDKVLRAVAEAMSSSVRSYDSVGRYGGEEFVLVMPGCDVETAVIAAERIRSCICEKSLEISGGPLSITISIGVAVTDGTRDMAPEAIIRMADMALYRAKERGRNCVELAEMAVFSKLGPLTPSVAGCAIAKQDRQKTAERR
jgi:diguanylate cyclase (GGDEF)-like protein